MDELYTSVMFGIYAVSRGEIYTDWTLGFATQLFSGLVHVQLNHLLVGYGLIALCV